MPRRGSGRVARSKGGLRIPTERAAAIASVPCLWWTQRACQTRAQEKLLFGSSLRPRSEVGTAPAGAKLVAVGHRLTGRPSGAVASAAVSCRMRGWRNAAFAFLSGSARVHDLASRASLYVAAGTLRRQALKAAITRTWDEFSRSDAEILSGLMPWEKAWYERVLKPADHILLVGCGTGRDLIALLELGYRVDGLDISGRAIELARRVLERRRLSAGLYTGPI